MSNPYSFGGDPQNNPYGGASPYGGAPDPYNPYGAPPQVNPYGAANPYGAPPQVNPYDASGYGQANYGAPPPGGYPYGGFDPNAQYGAAPPGYAYGGFPDPNAQYQADFRAGPSAPPAHPAQPGQPAHGAPGAPGVPGDPNSQGGWSTGQKVAVGVGVGVAVTAVAATVAALGIGGGYLAYNHHEASSQNASPIKLHVKVISASNLKAADSGGTSDPYVVLKVGYCGAKTPTLQKTLNPRWDAQFDFGVHDKQIPKEFLEVEVFDKDLLSDDALGNVKIPLSAIGNQPHRQSVKLEHVKTGEITLELWFTGRH